MTRIKLLAIATFAVAALAALPAIASASGGFAAGEYPASLHATPQGSFLFEGTKMARYNCAPEFSAELAGPSSALSSKSTTETCLGSEHWEMKGCGFTFHPGAKTFDIGSAGCGPTIVTRGCGPVKIPPQAGLAAEYSTTGSGSEAAVLVNVAAKNVEFVSDPCMGSVTYHDMTITGTWKITGTNKEGKKTGVEVFSAGGPPVGIFMAGGPAKFGTGEPRLDAQQFPVNVIGERWSIGEYKGKLTLLSIPQIAINCEAASFNIGEISGPVSKKMTISATSYEKCTSAKGAEFTAQMNSCHYAFDQLEQVVEGGIGTPEYEAVPKIECTTGGDAIKLLGGGGCIISIPAQTLSSAVPALENYGSSYQAVVNSIIAGGSVKYTTNNALGCKVLSLPVSGENGSLESDMHFRGVLP